MKHLVRIWEMDRFSGRKHDDDDEFYDTKEQAMERINKFNSYNNKSYVPEWYMYAEYVGEVNGK